MWDQTQLSSLPNDSALPYSGMPPPFLICSELESSGINETWLFSIKERREQRELPCAHTSSFWHCIVTKAGRACCHWCWEWVLACLHWIPYRNCRPKLNVTVFLEHCWEVHRFYCLELRMGRQGSSYYRIWGLSTHLCKHRWRETESVSRIWFVSQRNHHLWFVAIHQDHFCSCNCSSSLTGVPGTHPCM